VSTISFQEIYTGAVGYLLYLVMSKISLTRSDAFRQKQERTGILHVTQRPYHHFSQLACNPFYFIRPRLSETKVVTHSVPFLSLDYSEFMWR
jgi:hypothetical protein